MQAATIFASPVDTQFVLLETMTRHNMRLAQSQQQNYFLTADIHLLTPMHVQSNSVGWYDPSTGRISRVLIPEAQRCALTATAQTGGQWDRVCSAQPLIPVIPSVVLANRLMNVAERDTFQHTPSRSFGMSNSLHGECVGILEPLLHPDRFALDSPEAALPRLVRRLQEIDPFAKLRVKDALPVLNSLRGTFDPEPQVHALPFRGLEDMTFAGLVKPLRHTQEALIGRIEPRNHTSVDPSGEANSGHQVAEAGFLKVDALELVRPGINFHIRLQIETSDAAVVGLVSKWLQGLMRESQIGACGMLGQGLGRFECKASGLYAVNGQNSCPSPITSLFRSRQSGYSLCAHPLLA
jgi:hypothetical protein